MEGLGMKARVINRMKPLCRGMKRAGVRIHRRVEMKLSAGSPGEVGRGLIEVKV